MCGIAGILDPAGVTAAELQRMTDAMAHRGPDDATIHLEPGMGFGFRRLAIIDLVSGRQPISNEDESVVVMLNGEIYNYRSLRAGLLARGHRFRTESDTEVLVHLYEENGPALVRELRGMFGFAIWDRPRRLLFLARDHLGQKPLFWAQRGERFYFASEIKAILAVAPEFRVLDPQALDEYFTLRLIPDPLSMFLGIHKLPPAHSLLVQEGKPRIERYWRLDYQPKLQISEADALAQLDIRLREAVRAHLVSDVPVGAFLSGGLDSGLIVAMIREVTDQPLDTFSVGLPYGEFDETPAARMVAAKYRTRHHEEMIDGNLLGLLPELVYHLDEPSDPLSACLYHLAAFTRRYVKVAVGGDGGDELFGGYDRYYGNRYVQYYAALPRGVRRQVFRRMLSMVPDGFWYKSLSHKLRWLDQLAEVDGGRRYARSLSYFYFTPERRTELYSDHFREGLGSADPEECLIHWHDEPQVQEALDRMLLADSMVRLPNHSVMILDRMTMAHGLEARSPFLDHELVEFGARLPASLKVRGRTRRYLQRQLATRYLPPEILQRSKQGFSSALPYLMRDQFRIAFAHYLRQARLVDAGYLRGPAIEAMLDQHLGGRRDHGNRLWLLFNAEIWYRIQIERQPVSDLSAELAELLTPRRPHSAPKQPASTG